MDELVRQLTSRVGISEEQARQAIDTVLSFAKERLPALIAGQLESALESGTAGSVINEASKHFGAIGNMFGGKEQ